MFAKLHVKLTTKCVVTDYIPRSVSLADPCEVIKCIFCMCALYLHTVWFTGQVLGNWSHRDQFPLPCYFVFYFLYLKL